MIDPNALFLVVDDDDVFRSRLCVALKKRGYGAYEASSLAAVREHLSLITPTHAILDLRMPQSWGLDLLRELKQKVPDAKVLILTGYGSIATAIEAMREGAAGYLTKPTDLDAIINTFSSAPTPVMPHQESVPSLPQVEWEHIQRVMADCGGNISQAAKLLGLHRRSLQRKLKKLP